MRAAPGPPRPAPAWPAHLGFGHDDERLVDVVVHYGGYGARGLSIPHLHFVSSWGPRGAGGSATDVRSCVRWPAAINGMHAHAWPAMRRLARRPPPPAEGGATLQRLNPHPHPHQRKAVLCPGQTTAASCSWMQMPSRADISP